MKKKIALHLLELSSRHSNHFPLIYQEKEEGGGDI
jgi:hypothetical protein